MFAITLDVEAAINALAVELALGFGFAPPVTDEDEFSVTDAHAILALRQPVCAAAVLADLLRLLDLPVPVLVRRALDDGCFPVPAAHAA